MESRDQNGSKWNQGIRMESRNQNGINESEWNQRIRIKSRDQNKNQGIKVTSEL